MIKIIYDYSKQENQLSNKINFLNSIFRNFCIKNNIIHIFYRNNFNNIDLLDSYFYKVEDSHHYMDWRFKMIKSIIKFSIINCWIYSLEFEYMNLINLRNKLVEELLINSNK